MSDRAHSRGSSLQNAVARANATINSQTQRWRLPYKLYGVIAIINFHETGDIWDALFVKLYDVYFGQIGPLQTGHWKILTFNN